MNTIEKLEELYQKWEKQRNYIPFVRDGILLEDEWSNASPKIMFLMKESHKNTDWWQIAGSEIDISKNDKVRKIWENIVRWKFLLNSYFNDGVIPSFLEKEELFRKALPLKKLGDIAYVNVSKELGESSSNAKHLQNRAIEDREFLTQQIDIIDPEIILCANTFSCYHPIYNGNQTIEKVSDRIHKHKDRIIIEFYHPGPPAGNKDRALYQSFSDILKDHQEAIQKIG